MITSLSHASVFVHDQDEALRFYTEKLDFEVRTDQTLGDFRWLTVGPRDQRDLEIVLMKPTPGEMFTEETVNMIQALRERGVLGAGVFRTRDCQATYEQLQARGVEFLSPPRERPYGVEATFRDCSGNWYSLTQPR